MFGEGGRQERRKEEGKGKTHPKAGVQSARGPACLLRCREQLWRLERAEGQAAVSLRSPRGLRQLRVTSGTRSRICQIPRPQCWGKGVLLGLGWPFLLFLLDLA